MGVSRAVLTVITLVVLASAASATDWGAYNDFRHVSGLPGNGFSVSCRGQVGEIGACHMNVPAAYTPPSGNYVASYYAASRDSRAHFTLGGDSVDGSGALLVGLGRPGRAVAISESFVESRFSVNATNVQIQLQDETREMPAIAIGCQDIFDQRQDAWGQRHGARSLYVVATRQTDPGVPVYVSLGYGNHRFNDRLFGAVNWWPDKSTTLGFEYDGFVPRPYVNFRLPQSGAWGFSLGAAWSDFSRPVLGASFSYTQP